MEKKKKKEEEKGKWKRGGEREIECG